MFFKDVIDINETNLLQEYPEVLHTLLKDMTTGKYLLWCTDDYAGLGDGYQPADEMLPERITVENEGIIKSRCMKDRETQIRRIRAKGEVFTPSWLCDKMNNAIDEEGKKPKDWRDYIRAKRLEITCGEAPFLCSRYDMVTGDRILPLGERIGLLDRKLQLIQKKTRVKDKELWLDLVRQALQSVYGYDWQGDNVVLARENLLMDVIAFYQHKFKEDPSADIVQGWAEIIAWNIWQMDGLKYVIPNSCHDVPVNCGLEGFGDDCEGEMEPCPGCKHSRYNAHNGIYCRIMDWDKGEAFEFKSLVKEGGMMPKKADFKFDVIIGNPPYQDVTIGDNETYMPSVYDKFMDAAFSVGAVVELVHPARFLFAPGRLDIEWRNKILADKHLMVKFYEKDCTVFFPGIEIKGGVAVTYRDAEKVCGPIGDFVEYNEIANVKDKILKFKDFVSLSTIVYSSYSYNFTELMHKDNPDIKAKLSKGTEYSLRTSIFKKVPELFYDRKPLDKKDYVEILGLDNLERKYKYIRADYVTNKFNMNKYKVVIPKASGSGIFGETIALPVVAKPNTGTTQSFITLGAFSKEEDANSAVKYIKTKFVRALLGILKVTQDITVDKWKYVPLQDFTANSDIDWSKSVADIDQQLYKKYELSKEEIDFIESHVKEMV